MYPFHAFPAIPHDSCDREAWQVAERCGSAEQQGTARGVPLDGEWQPIRPLSLTLLHSREWVRVPGQSRVRQEDHEGHRCCHVPETPWRATAEGDELVEF